MKKRIFNRFLLVGIISAAISAVLCTVAAFILLYADLDIWGLVLALCSLFATIVFSVYLVVRHFSKHAFAPIDKLASEYDFRGDDIGELLKSLQGKVHTQDKEIKHQLSRVEKEKNRLSTIINNMDEGLIILDNDLRVIMLNDSAYSWLGTSIPKEECAGKPMTAVCASSEICDCIERADSVNLTIDDRHLQLHVNHVVSNAEQVGRIGLLLDVTERYAIDKIKQEFTANVSHELKTPLTSILGYAELIESEMASGDDALLFAGRIRRESVRMLALISDIIKLSRLDEESDRYSLEAVDIYTVALECKDILDMNAEKQRVTIKVEGESCYIQAFPGEISELIYNLIDNGIRYNRDGGEVRVLIESVDGEENANFGTAVARITVSDTGIGISDEHLSRVFERFYRVDKSRSKETGGTGLGLAIVKHVAERHHAKIAIDSKVGCGTVIKVTFFESSDIGIS